MIAAVEDLLHRAIRLQMEKRIGEQEAVLDQFATSGCMLYPNHRPDVSICVEFRGLEHRWWIR